MWEIQESALKRCSQTRDFASAFVVLATVVGKACGCQSAACLHLTVCLCGWVINKGGSEKTT
jgi:hypothetical protein